MVVLYYTAFHLNLVTEIELTSTVLFKKHSRIFFSEFNNAGLEITIL